MSERLRVLMIGPFPNDPTLVVGGVEAANFALCSALADHPDIEKILAVDLRLARTAGRIFNDKLESRFVKVPFLSGDGLVRSLPAVLEMRKIVKAFRPHIVHGQGIGRPGDIAVQLGLPTVVTIHGMIHVEARVTEATLFRPLKVWVLDDVVRRVLRKADVAISTSEYDARELAPMIHGQRVSIPNVVPAAFFSAHSKPTGQPVVLFAGLMRERKNVLGLIECFRDVANAVPTAKLIITGPTYDESYGDLVKERVNSLGLQDVVQFRGHVSVDILIDAIANSAVVALFSREDTLPTIIAQSMAVGRAVVATDVGGISGMVSNGQTGYLVRSEDEAEMAQRLIELLSNPATAARFGEAGAMLASTKYGERAIAQQTLDAYRRALPPGRVKS